MEVINTKYQNIRNVIAFQKHFFYLQTYFTVPKLLYKYTERVVKQRRRFIPFPLCFEIPNFVAFLLVVFQRYF
jgi:hypothetical protein